MPVAKALSRETAISVGVVVVIAGAAWAAGAKLTGIERDVHANAKLILALQTSVESKMEDRWRGHQMRAWAQELQRLNPELSVPGVILEP